MHCPRGAGTAPPTPVLAWIVSGFKTEPHNLYYICNVNYYFDSTPGQPGQTAHF
jgi:hypothetical protein